MSSGGYWVKSINGDYVNLAAATHIGAQYDIERQGVAVVATFPGGDKVFTELITPNDLHCQIAVASIVTALNGEVVNRSITRLADYISKQGAGDNGA